MLKPTLLAGLVLAAGALAGCGGDDADTGATDTETYCTQLKADKEYFNAFGGGGGSDIDPSQFGEALDRFHGLADAAPEDIAPQWDVLDGTLSEIERALAEAGISTEDLAGLQNGEVPKGVDMGKLAGLAPKLQNLDSPELRDAAKAIQKHAKTECGISIEAAG